jgi:hypothetical protein
MITTHGTSASDRKEHFSDVPFRDEYERPIFSDRFKRRKHACGIWPLSEDGGGAMVAAQAALGGVGGGASHSAQNTSIPDASNRVDPDDNGGTDGGLGALARRKISMLLMQALFHRTVSLPKRHDL